MTDQAQPKIVSAAQLKEVRHAEEVGEVVELSSGNAYRLRRPRLMSLVAQGLIPAQLVHSAVNAQNDAKRSPQDVANVFQLWRAIAPLAVMEPKVVKENPADDEITVDDLPEEDLQEIFIYTQSSLEGLRRFRQERQGTTAGSDLQEVPGDQAESTVRPESAG